MCLYPSIKFSASKFNLCRMFVSLFIFFGKSISKMLYFLIKKGFYMGLLEAVSLFASLLVGVRLSTLRSPYTLKKRELFWELLLLLSSLYHFIRDN